MKKPSNLRPWGRMEYRGIYRINSIPVPDRNLCRSGSYSRG
ncbi:hypothetical protein J2T16_001614 [Paenibacillus intestini]|nr:hypothetical protein [Paenibacillus intestini]